MEASTSEQIREWAERIKASDQQAFNRLFRLLYPQLVPYACRYLRDKAAASDIVQEVFITLWEKRDRLDPNQSVKSYLYKIVRNRSLNYLRDHSRESVGLDAMEGSQQMQAESDVDSVSVTSGTDLETLMQQWISDLPERQQEAFELSRFEGLDHDEIAEVMSISANTVNNHIVAALNTLRDRYTEYQQETPS